MSGPVARRPAAPPLACSLGCALALASTPPVAQESGFRPLFDGVDLEGWYTWDAAQGRNADRAGYFKVRDGRLDILAIPATDEEIPFGYVATERVHADYHLRFEYRWGSKRFAPRATALRDSGLLYHLRGPDRIWPTSLESQVQEGDTGDLFQLGGPRSVVTQRDRVHDPEAAPERLGGMVRASEIADRLDGWNLSEVIVRGASAVHIVNGRVVNRLSAARIGDTPLDSGRIAFQLEGAEISYRNIELRELPRAPRVLLFSETRGFRHRSIPAALDALETLLGEAGIGVDRAADSSGVFTDANLARYAAVAWVMTTGDVLSREEQHAFEHFIRAGGGFAGIHSASDTEYDWPWYGRLVGARFRNHPKVQTATQIVEDRGHPSTARLGGRWTREDEWYNFAGNPRSRVNVLLSLDESSYEGGDMGDHPIAWWRAFEGGRAWYTGGGHTEASYAEADFRAHLLGGIRYAAGLAGDGGANDPAPSRVSAPSPDAAVPAQARGGALPPRGGWRASASSSRAGGEPAKALDASPTSRWTTGVRQRPGQWFQLDLGRVATVSGVTLALDAAQPFDQPRGYEVYLSKDGELFGDPVASGEGTSPRTVIDFAPAAARYLRIVQTGSDGFRWWSIYELELR